LPASAAINVHDYKPDADRKKNAHHKGNTDYEYMGNEYPAFNSHTKNLLPSITGYNDNL
jgi:hypothetical protein